LFLTKALGTGIVGTAIKFDRIGAALADQAIASMRTLNRAAAEALQPLPPGAVHACTDITGFGLIGHASGMAAASGVTLVIHAGKVPVFEGVLSIASRNRSGGMESNQDHFSGFVRTAEGAEPVGADVESLLYDPQTSGGLLIAAGADRADEVEAALRRAGVPAPRVGTAEASMAGIRVRIRP
jgi:selenide,water dikinase